MGYIGIGNDDHLGLQKVKENIGNFHFQEL